ncbi:MAG TPA: UDP-N-acetylmuramoyl-L-alanine--D-glutamate ligase [Phycisphaerae bacterium]|nr:UDP-N-acetylmuramoyl-L-alanine--D-glutamate ligase [Phycisphaerae bacterium]
MTASNLARMPVVVMGLGRFGGGIGVTRWLVQQGARVTVTDQADAEALAGSVAQLTDLPVTFHLGGHDPRDLEDCRLLVVSPAVAKERSPFVQAAIARGIPLSSEMNLFVERCPARRVVGITGTAGKSTTTAMIGAILEAAHTAGAGPRVWVGGNIGQSLLADLDDMQADDIVVLELSSFQLEDLGVLRWSPSHAVITNIQPNHLDRHGTLGAYRDAKLNIVRFQRPADLVFVNERDRELIGHVAGVGGAERLRTFAFEQAWRNGLQVPGRHNEDNAAAAIAVVRSLDVADAHIRQGLAGFRGLPHRLEFVASRRGVRYYNDSKSTTPGSAHLALESFDGPVVMLIGGRDKGMSFEALARLLARRAKGVVCYGETGLNLYEEIRRHGAGGSSAEVHLAGPLEEAVGKAASLAAAGDVVVLSPACTSYDQFANYEQRGETFSRLVRDLPD